MRILIVTLHVRASAQAVPLAAGCLKACLPTSLQQQTDLIDLFPEIDTMSQAQQLLDLNPSVIAFPLYLWNRKDILLLSQQLRQKKPDLILLAGGPEASADSHNVIIEGALDGVIRGEGEVAFADSISALYEKTSTSEIPGFLSATQTEATIPPAAVCPDLSLLPSPWLTGQLTVEEDCGVLWEVARGCQFNCAFCYDAKGLQGVRPLPLKRLRKELQLFAKQQVSQVWILDSTFNAPPERGRQLLEMLLELAPHIHYHIEAKADFLDSQTIELLSQLSCSVQIGLQSASEHVLKPLHRGLIAKQMTQRLSHMSDVGITFGLDLIYGLPGDNHSGFEKSLDFALKLQPNQIDVFPLAVLPGTELFENQEAFGIQGDPRPPYLIRSNTTYSEEDLQKSHLLAAATDIFYNRGRAVGFFLQLCESLSLAPSFFLQQFSEWFCQQENINQSRVLDIESWTPRGILPLQQKYVRYLFSINKKDNLIDITEDLINYHFFCAESLLADDCRPMEERPNQSELMQCSWALNPAVELKDFHFSLEALETVGGEPLKKIIRKVTPEPEKLIFLRQQGEVIVESLDDDFATLLNRARNKKTTKQLLQGIEPQTATELMDFAVSQGLLLPEPPT